jgi:hypothetical protein
MVPGRASSSVLPPHHASRCSRACAPRADRTLCRPARLLALVLGLWAACAAHAAQPWRIVILHGADPAQPAAMQQDRAFRRALEAAAPDGVEFYTDPIDGLRFQGGDLLPDFLALLTRKYQRREVDLVVGVADFALDFAERYHAQLWPGKPVLIHSIEERRLRKRGLPADFAWLPLRIDVDGTLAIVEALQPAARRLVVVAGSTTIDVDWGGSPPTRRGNAPRARGRSRCGAACRCRSCAPASPRSTRRARRCCTRSCTATATAARGSPPRRSSPWRSVVRADLRLVSELPRAGPHRGLARRPRGQRPARRGAGHRPSCAASGRRPARARAHRRRAAPLHVARVQAFGLDLDALPAGCVLAFRPPSLWHDYGAQMLAGAAVLALQAATIAALLVQRRRRRAAEDEAAQRRTELNRAARLSSMGELSASIAHEVGQPLAAIVTNSQAGRADAQARRRRRRRAEGDLRRRAPRCLARPTRWCGACARCWRSTPSSSRRWTCGSRSRKRSCWSSPRRGGAASRSSAASSSVPRPTAATRSSCSRCC